MEYFEVKGEKIPKLGFGTYDIAPADTKQAVKQALKLGYRLIDTAQYYRNEAQVGEAVRESDVKREDIFITTKAMTDGYEATKLGIEESLQKAGLSYFDLMIIHWPMEDSLGTYRAMAEAYHEGKLHHIGLSNFNINQTKEIMANSDVKPLLDQIETHLNLQQGKMHEFLTREGIIHESYSPLMEDAPAILKHPVLQKIGRKYGKTGVQVMLRFLTQEDIMVIPRSVNPKHMQENFEIFDFTLTPAEVAEIKELDKRQPIDGWPATMRVDE
ncbi:aldo/keto reductase [Lactobacillus sp. PV012]|uniref:aldo/keto reductase n=1 Tax=Lactobacillus sp. PV012 TaxID=2594494 RepID=UPI00223ED87C|nr:aldo/keto reductase [Lactobacillus sp. PV012]QNQ81736.1 aldo/keto reductase [Lactobacillus sp. PV012]